MTLKGFFISSPTDCKLLELRNLSLVSAVLTVVCLRQVSFFAYLDFMGRKWFLKLLLLLCFFLIGSSVRAVTKEVLEVIPASHLGVTGGLMEIIVITLSKL